MTNRREWFLLIGVALFLLTLTVLTVQAQGSDETDDLSGSSYANGRNGGRALYLWMDEMGYDVVRYQPSDYTLPRVDSVLWLLAPTEFMTVEDSEALAEWVDDGGTLVAVQTDDFTFDEAFNLEDTSNNSDNVLYPAVPWLKAGRGQYNDWTRYELPRGAMPLLADSNGVVGAFVMPYGEGELWVFPSIVPFTNVSLRDSDDSAFVESLLAQLPDDVPHHFDEYHHGFGVGFGFNNQRGLIYRMVREPWGWGILYAVGIVAMWIILRGRRFGRAIPLPNEHLRREAGEYVQGLAWLYRRARLRNPIQRYRLPFTADDAAFVAALARIRPDIDKEALAVHLTALQRQVSNEGQLRALMETHQKWLQLLVR